MIILKLQGKQHFLTFSRSGPKKGNFWIFRELVNTRDYTFFKPAWNYASFDMSCKAFKKKISIAKSNQHKLNTHPLPRTEKQESSTRTHITSKFPSWTTFLSTNHFVLVYLNIYLQVLYVLINKPFCVSLSEHLFASFISHSHHNIYSYNFCSFLETSKPEAS